jgi:transcriptional regulator with XRE-family HTH domain
MYPGIEQEVGLSSAALRAGELVRGMRKAKGWTQTQLADVLGWDQVRISNIERGEGTRGPTFDVLTKIAEACGYDWQFAPREVAEAIPARQETGGRARPAIIHHSDLVGLVQYGYGLKRTQSGNPESDQNAVQAFSRGPDVAKSD